MIARPVGRPGAACSLVLKALEVLDHKLQARLEILCDGVCIDRTPILASSGIVTGTRMGEKDLFVLQSHVSLTAEGTYPKSACAPERTCIFSLPVFLVSESAEITLFGQ